MRLYLNPENDNYREMRSMDTYVDKSGMISVVNGLVNGGNKYVCISRPRRFGKTIAQNMLVSYYSKGCDSHVLFDKLKISGDPEYEMYLNKYNVIQLDLNSEYQNIRDKEKLIPSIQEKIKKEMREEYPDIALGEDDSLAEGLLKVYAATGDIFLY